MIAEIVSRSQPAKGRSRRRGFAGPDHHTVVVLRPEGSEPVGSTPLVRATIERRGWETHECGEWYYRSRGPRSRYAEALAEAERFIQAVGATLYRQEV